MEVPELFSFDEMRNDPRWRYLAEATLPLQNFAHISAIAALVRQSHEHTCMLSDYARVAIPDSQLTFKRYGASAFDQETVQDMKYHKNAYEFYLALQGSFKIHWKVKGDSKLRKSLDMSCNDKCWAIIPPGICLLVERLATESFLAVACKSQESNRKNEGKQSGEKCKHNEDCPTGEMRIQLEKNRKDFFAKIANARETAAKRVSEIILEHRDS